MNFNSSLIRRICCSSAVPVELELSLFFLDASSYFNVLTCCVASKVTPSFLCVCLQFVPAQRTSWALCPTWTSSTAAWRSSTRTVKSSWAIWRLPASIETATSPSSRYEHGAMFSRRSQRHGVCAGVSGPRRETDGDWGWMFQHHGQRQRVLETHSQPQRNRIKQIRNQIMEGRRRPDSWSGTKAQSLRWNSTGHVFITLWPALFWPVIDATSNPT